MNIFNKNTALKSISNGLKSPAFLSLSFHGMIFAAIFGNFVNNNIPQYNEFQFISFSNITELEQTKQSSKASSQKKEKSRKITKLDEGDNKKSEKESINSKKVLAQKSSQFNSYVNAIASELERRKSKLSLTMAPENVKTIVVFKVKLDENGKLVEYKLSKNSGYDFFDKIAMKILTYRKSFPTPPQEIKMMNLEFSIPIIFDSLA